jgi:hypothetical protein
MVYLSVLIFIVTIFLGITVTSLPAISSYGQQSHNLMNSIPSTNDPPNQREISDGRQPPIVLPSISGKDIAVVEEQVKDKEDKQQGETLSKHTATDLIKGEEREEDEIVRSMQQNEEDLENNDNGYEVEDDNNDVPLQLPFP